MKGAFVQPRVVLSSVVLGLALLRPLAYSVGPIDLMGFWVFVLLYVAVPGILLARALAVLDDDVPMLLGTGLVLGLCLQATALLVSRLIDWPAAFYAYPLLVVAACGKSAMPPWPRRVHAGSHLVLLAVLAFSAQEFHALFSSARLSGPLPMDLLFHAGNAAELRHHWPMEDPRVAGTSLFYHFFGYSLPAMGASFAGGAVAPVLLAMLPGPLVALFGLQIYNTGRVLLGTGLAGAAGAALVLFHVDIGAELIPALGSFRSHLGSATYGSTTTLIGFVYLVTLAAVLHRYLVGECGRPRSHLAVLGLVAFAASGTKGSVMPMVVVGLMSLLVLRVWTSRRLDRRAAAAVLVAGIAATPMTAYLSLGEASYSGMFQFLPGTVPGGSGFFRSACALLSGPARDGLAPCAEVGGPWLLVLTGVWALGYLGPGGWLGLAWLWEHRKQLRDTDTWIVGMSLAGASLAYLLASTTGLSQLFFAYNGQVMLGILGGGFVASAAKQRPWRSLVLVVCAVAAVPVLARMAQGVRNGVESDLSEVRRVPSDLEAQYGQALAFLRDQTPPYSTVMGRPGSLLVSAFGERRSYYETGYFTARAHRLRGQGVAQAFPERIAVLVALWTTGNPVGLGPPKDRRAAPVLFFLDDIDPGVSPGWTMPVLRAIPPGVLRPPVEGTLLFRNSTAAIYRLDGHP